MIEALFWSYVYCIAVVAVTVNFNWRRKGYPDYLNSLITFLFYIFWPLMIVAYLNRRNK